MPVRSYQIPLGGPNNGSFYKEVYYNSSENSAKGPNGKLKLTAHAHEYYKGVVTHASSPSGTIYGATGGATPAGYPWSSDEYNQVYARFRGQLHKGDASLGVSFASWRQSRDMILSRCEKLNDFFSLSRTSRAKRRKKPKRGDQFSRKKLASDVLEGEFGWVPLLQDIHNALVTAMGPNAVPSNWVRSSMRFPYARQDIGKGEPNTFVSYSGYGRLTIAAACTVTNPNLWLLNRLGLINPATVAWDLVPWSFVVNMFVNVNQVINSFTDTVGLELSQCTVTRSSRVFVESTYTWKLPPWEGWTSRISSNNVKKSRIGGPLPRPSLTLKAPKLDWNLAVIASALVVQKVKRFH